MFFTRYSEICLKRNLGMTELCLQWQKFYSFEICTSRTCIERKSTCNKKFCLLWFRYRQVSLCYWWRSQERSCDRSRWQMYENFGVQTRMDAEIMGLCWPSWSLVDTCEDGNDLCVTRNVWNVLTSWPTQEGLSCLELTNWMIGWLFI